MFLRLMSKSIENTRLLLEEITMKCDANWIAFSGGLDSSILGQIKKDQDLNGLTIIAKDFIGTDLSYSQIMGKHIDICLLYTSPRPRDQRGSRMPSSA